MYIFEESPCQTQILFRPNGKHSLYAIAPHHALASAKYVYTKHTHHIYNIYIVYVMQMVKTIFTPNSTTYTRASPPLSSRNRTQ